MYTVYSILQYILHAIYMNDKVHIQDVSPADGEEAVRRFESLPV